LKTCNKFSQVSTLVYLLNKATTKFCLLRTFNTCLSLVLLQVADQVRLVTELLNARHHVD